MDRNAMYSAMFTHHNMVPISVFVLFNGESYPFFCNALCIIRLPRIVFALASQNDGRLEVGSIKNTRAI